MEIWANPDATEDARSSLPRHAVQSDVAGSGVSMQHWYVYLLECADGTLYCGITTAPERRVMQHNGERPGGARYTRSRRPVVLRACAPCPDRSAALKLEHHLRTLPRQQKIPTLLRLNGVGPENS